MDMQTYVVILLYCICVVTGETTFWVDLVDSTAYEPHVSENQTSWWDAANHECAKSDGHLFVPQEAADVDRVNSLIDEHKVYWVGGFQYPYLKWTEDDTRYHTRVGYMDADVVSPFTLQYNSVSNCARRCGNSHRLYGLQGTSCYCLGYNPRRQGIVDGYKITETQCPGDVHNWCGDGSVMGVYRKDYNSYRRVGYMYAGFVTSITLLDNSAFRCDLNCGNNHHLYGLQGTSCYCLGYRLRTYNITERDRREIRCPGDYDERCGDDAVMTVYKKDAIFVPLSPNGKCGYVEKFWSNGRYNPYAYALYHLDENCDEKRQYICAADTGCSGYWCIRSTPRTWEEASRDCNLTKLIVSSVISYMYSNLKYWIGLERSVERKWISGKVRRGTGESYFSNSDSHYLDQRCLGVYRNGSSLLETWFDCSRRLPALCNTVKRESTPLILNSTSTVRPSTQAVRASTQVVRASTQAVRASTQVVRELTHGSSSVTFPESTAEPTVSTPTKFPSTDSSPSSGERTTSHYVKGFVNKGTDKGEGRPPGFTVIYIVGAASVLAVVIVITLVLVMKRQRRFCFKMEDEGVDDVHYAIGVENLSYSLAGPRSQSATNEDANPCSAQTEKNAPMSTEKSNVPKENPVSNNGFKQEESVYNVLDKASPVKPPRTGRLRVKKDTTTNPSDKGACFEDEDEDQYNVLRGQVVARGGNSGMYAHLGQGEGGGVYDTTRHLQNTERFSDTYNHTAPSKEPTADDEDQYNVLRRVRSQSAADGSTGIYDHTTTSADQRSKASQPEMDGIYSQVDRASKRPKQDKLVTECKEHKRDDAKTIGKADVDCDSTGVSGGNTTEHVYGNTGEIIGPCNKARCVEDEADYYNIDAVRESKLGSTSKEGEEDGNNVYSLAHGFSSK